jgi:transcription antitermination factor NusG
VIEAPKINEVAVMTLTPEQNPASHYPENVLHNVFPDDCWWVAHTKSRREKTLAHVLASEEIGYFLPLCRRRQPNRQRERFSLVPMFPGYVFFKGNGEERYLAYRSNHIARIIRIQDRRRLLEELRQIETSMEAQVPVYPHAFLKKGQRVRVRYGPLKGLEGIISRKKAEYRLVLNVTFITQAVALDVDAEMVEAA